MKLKTKIISAIVALTAIVGSGVGIAIANRHEHNYQTEITEPTCTKKGFSTYTCECGDVYIDAYTEKLGHNPVIDEAVATCTEIGLSEGKHCSRCEKVLVAQRPLKARGHKEKNIRLRIQGI